ncbi:putative ubiquitin carboxyl-terminal hydrolase 50 [Frankliniella occidentalis]|uniref:Ubiquitin carboxyl-terminal hydrolase n=1 Tax=Frankliniella occidentalis TaxID=133901 RepID=A0A9C6X398_FRAOC|nr:putative ubiquitin carboxyl-terminal hydrolase 50 [Frankliniella occidentalis]
MGTQEFVFSQVGSSAGPGFVNVGNNCYVNSVLQCLFSLEEIQKLCVDLANHNIKGSGNVATAVSHLWNLRKRAKDLAVAPVKFLAMLQKEWPEFLPKEQMDSSQFLYFLLNSLHNELLVSLVSPKILSSNFTDKVTYPGVTCCIRSYSNFKETPLKEDSWLSLIVHSWKYRVKSPISEIFGVQVVRLTSCSGGCSYENVSCRDIDFITTIFIPECESIALSDCLRSHCKENFLTDSKCDFCKKVGTLRTTLLFGRVPKVFVIQLGRFVQRSPTHFHKNNAAVEFEQNLNLADYVVEGLQTQTSYSLVGVTNHSGSLQSGHYTSFIRKNDRWYEFDDSRVSSVTSRKLDPRKAYLLWYSRLPRVVPDGKSSLPTCSPINVSAAPRPSHLATPHKLQTTQSDLEPAPSPKKAKV